MGDALLGISELEYFLLSCPLENLLVQCDGAAPDLAAGASQSAAAQTSTESGTAAAYEFFNDVNRETAQPAIYSSLISERTSPNGLSSLQQQGFASNHPQEPLGRLHLQDVSPSSGHAIHPIHGAQDQPLTRALDIGNPYDFRQLLTQQHEELYRYPDVSAQQLPQTQPLIPQHVLQPQQLLPAVLQGPGGPAPEPQPVRPQIHYKFAQQLGLQANDQQLDGVALRIGELLYGICHMNPEEQQGLLRRLLPDLAPHDPALSRQTSWPDLTGLQQAAFLAVGSVKGKCNLGGLASGRAIIAVPGMEGVYVAAYYGKRCSCGGTHKSPDCKGHPFDPITKYCLVHDGPVAGQHGKYVNAKMQSGIAKKWVPDTPFAVLYHIKPRVVPPGASGTATATTMPGAVLTGSNSASSTKGQQVVSMAHRATISTPFSTGPEHSPLGPGFDVTPASSSSSGAQPGNTATGGPFYVASQQGVTMGANAGMSTSAAMGADTTCANGTIANHALFSANGTPSDGSNSADDINHASHTAIVLVGEHIITHSGFTSTQTGDMVCAVSSSDGRYKRQWHATAASSGFVPSMEEVLYAVNACSRQIQEPWVRKMVAIVQHLTTSPSPAAFRELLWQLDATPKELQEMVCPGEGQRLVHLLLTPPRLLLRADVVTSPAWDPDEGISEDEAGQLIQVLLQYLQCKLGGSQQAAARVWSDMLEQVDARHSENGVHVAARHGHRLKLLQTWVLPYASGFALLQPTHRNYIPMHAAYRFTRDKAGGLLLERLLHVLRKLALTMERTRLRPVTLHDLRQKVIYNLNNKYFTGRNSEAEGYKAPVGASGSELLAAHCQRLLPMVEDGAAAAAGPALPFPAPEPRNRQQTMAELLRLQGVASIMEGPGWPLQGKCCG